MSVNNFVHYFCPSCLAEFDCQADAVPQQARCNCGATWKPKTYAGRFDQSQTESGRLRSRAFWMNFLSALGMVLGVGGAFCGSVIMTDGNPSIGLLMIWVGGSLFPLALFGFLIAQLLLIRAALEKK